MEKRDIKKSTNDFAVKYCLGLLLFMSIFVNILTYQSNELLKKQNKGLMIENMILTHEGNKLYNSFQKLINLFKQMDEELKENERSRLEA
jgi:hypothetical protein